MFLDRLKTFLLLIGMTALLLFFGSFFGRPGLISAIVTAIILNSFVFFFSDKFILGFYRARPMDPDYYPGIYDTVKELTQAMKIPMPRLWIVQSPVANALATGRSPRHSAVAVTSGALDLLDRGEMRGILAHELSHIKNRDILFATIASTIATAIGYLAQSLQYATIFRRQDPEHPKKNPLGTAIAAVLVPVAALLMRLAVSRSREYQADETGSYYSGDPLALASALQKLHDHKKHAAFNPNLFSRAATAELFTVNPFLPTKGRSWIHLFLTHPPVENRIERLKGIYEQMQEEQAQ